MPPRPAAPRFTHQITVALAAALPADYDAISYRPRARRVAKFTALFLGVTATGEFWYGKARDELDKA